MSACLVGSACAYDGKDRMDRRLLRPLEDHPVVPLCPEQLGGLPTPREPAEITGGDGADVLAGRARVVTCGGADVTRAFLRGAREAARLAERLACRAAVLKPRSPACSPAGVYDGTFSGQLVAGRGAAACALARVVDVIRSPEQLLCVTGGEGYQCERG